MAKRFAPLIRESFDSKLSKLQPIRMRKDMSKVVTERPRHGHYLPSRKTRLRIRRYDPNKDYDELPKRVSGSRNKHLLHAQGKLNRSYEKVKHFSDLIGPLERYLHSNVGRPWDEVFSEMKQTLDSRKVTGNHVFEHVDSLVDLEVLIGEDGKAYDRRTGRIRLSGLYVNPQTGLLCWAEYEKKKAASKDEPAELTQVLLGKNSGYFKLHGIWHFAEFFKVTDEKDCYRDGGTGCCVMRADRRKFPSIDCIYQPDQKLLILLKKEALTRKERRDAGLHNDPNTVREPNAIRFSDEAGNFGCFSTFSRHSFTLKEKVWPTVEHYYQAQMFAGTRHEEAIRQAASPMIAANMATDNTRPRRDDWSEVADSIMRDAVLAKFSQHKGIRQILLSTGNTKLVKHDDDSYWGDGGDGSGKNILGQILMSVREELRAN